MTVVSKVNPIQNGISKGLSKAQGQEGADKKFYVRVREMNLEKGFKMFEKY